MTPTVEQLELPSATYRELQRLAHKRSLSVPRVVEDLVSQYDRKEQDETYREDRDKLHCYLGLAAGRGDISEELMHKARKAWEQIEEQIPAFAIPHVSTAPNLQVMYTWDSEEHHLILEVFASGDTELFYRNRNTGEVWDYDYRFDQPLPSEIVTKIQAAYRK